MLEDLLFGTGPIREIQQTVGPGHPDVFRWIGLLGDSREVMLALGVGMWLYGRSTTYALVGSIPFGALTKLLLNLVFVGLVAGAGIALVSERKWLEYGPPTRGTQCALAVLTGLAGLLPLAFVMRYIQGADWYMHVASVLVLILWTLLAAPWLVQKVIRDRNVSREPRTDQSNSKMRPGA